MKAIILAAGEGKRMRPLTLETPKPMIEVLGRPLLHWIIDSLPAEITELIIVVGYKREKIQQYFGDSFAGRTVRYVVQEKMLGNAQALALCRPLLAEHERFLFLFGDDLHSAEAIKKLLRHDLGALVHEHANPSRFGVFEVNAAGKIVSMEEKPLQPKSNLVAVGVYVLDARIFNYEAYQHENGEFYMTDQINQIIHDHPFIVEKSDFWHPVGYPQDIQTAEEILKERGFNATIDRTKIPVIIIAGGKGTRLPAEEQDKPKCLVEIAGKPILAWQLEELRRQGFTSITLALGYKAEMVVAWLKASGNETVRYSIEKEPLGTGGALKLAARGITVPFIAFNCDDLANVHFDSLVRHGCGGMYNVMCGMQFSAAHTFDSIVCDEFKKICEFKQRSVEVGDAMVNIGHYYLRPDIFDGTPDSFSSEKDLFPRLAKEGKLVLYTHTGYWLTANNAEQIKGTRDFFAKGKKEVL